MQQFIIGTDKKGAVVNALPISDSVDMVLTADQQSQYSIPDGATHVLLSPAYGNTLTVSFTTIVDGSAGGASGRQMQIAQAQVIPLPADRTTLSLKSATGQTINFSFYGAYPSPPNGSTVLGLENGNTFLLEDGSYLQL